ncbi:hypothetical protein CYY_009242 [Polysphondylium violaceum]|uniref:Ankyrin repeat-containing protein n=1 Tax=Polysphondylium violaceum TaxID=133409 RepID=A0A8J4PNQ8_9MYCE|nr:hypothetical protein CYY_009242 [Polysphondylium violaceum]
MDQLFRQVFFNHPFLRKEIFDRVLNDVNCKTSNYKNSFNIGVLIKGGYLELLKLKLRNKEYLMLDKNGAKQVLLLKDTQLFIQLYNKFRDSFPAGSLDVVTSCSHKDYWDNAIYLLEQGCFYRDYALLNQAILHENVQMVQELATKTKLIDFSSLLNAVKTKNMAIISTIFKIFNKEFNALKLYKKEHILVGAVKTGDVTIVHTIKKYFESSFYFFSWRKSIYNNSLIWKIYEASMSSFECYQFVKENFDLSITLVDDPPILYNPFVSIGKFGNEMIFKDMMDNNRFNTKYTSNMVNAALENNHISFYKYIQTFKDIEINTKTIFLLNIKGPLDNFDHIKFLVENVHTCINKKDIQRALKSSFELFVYLYKRSIADGHSYSNDPEFLNELLIESYRSNNPQVVLFLQQQKIFFEETLLWPSLVNITDRTKDYYQLIQTLFSVYPPISNVDIQSFIHILVFFASWENPKIFKLIYSKIFELLEINTYEKIDVNDWFLRCIESASKQARYQTVLFLLNDTNRRTLTPRNYTSILEAAADSGSKQIINYILENHFNDLSMDIDLCILEKAISASHYDCVQLLFPLCKNLFHLKEQCLSDLGTSNNLPLVKYLFSHNDFNALNFEVTLFQSMRTGNALSSISNPTKSISKSVSKSSSASVSGIGSNSNQTIVKIPGSPDWVINDGKDQIFYSLAEYYDSIYKQNGNCYPQ